MHQTLDCLLFCYNYNLHGCDFNVSTLTNGTKTKILNAKKRKKEKRKRTRRREEKGKNRTTKRKTNGGEKDRSYEVSLPDIISTQ